MKEFIIKNNQELKLGYTTGTCATAAAKAAALMLLEGTIINNVKILTPAGIELNLDIIDINIKDSSVSCGVKKDAGDDPDITNGITIYAEVKKIKEKDIIIDGGIGIGRVTKKGLDQEVGQAAINSTPRRTIKEEIEKVRKECNYQEGFLITIFAPEGLEIATKTFNPKLGIVGGISILGTSGIVYPMSDQALLDTIKTELNVLKANNIDSVILAPGNYGETFLNDNIIKEPNNLIKCSNFIGESIEYINYLKFKKILLVSHIGKIVKLAGGIMNTHSKYAECRNEILASNAGMLGLSHNGIKQVMDAAMTDDMLDIIDQEKLKEKVLELILDKIINNINTKCHNEIDIDIVIFSNKYGYLISNKDLKTIKREWERND